MQQAIVMKKGSIFHVQISGDGPFAKGIHRKFKTKKAATEWARQFNQLESVRAVKEFYHVYEVS